MARRTWFPVGSDHFTLRLLATLAVGVLLAPAAVQAQDLGLAEAPSRTGVQDGSEPDIPEKRGKVLTAFRVDGPPDLDGVLDEPAWLLADSTDSMVQWDPDNMSGMSERTVVRVLYDERYLYVGVRLLDRNPGAIARGLGRRDRPPPSDLFEIGFDTQHDHLTGYVFATNASGVQREKFLFDDTAEDVEYNAVWEVETRIDETGWTAEYRIPFSQMRFQAPPSGRVVWGLDFRREIQRRNESGQWIGKPRGANGQVSRWGHLHFEEGLGRPRRIEALPFVVARGDDPAATGFDDGYDAGLDLRTGLGRSATLSATVNPDFGQVEADPAVLNLGVFETFFPEKRPFFLDDGTLFVPAYPLMTLFHSRRIGRRPGYLRVAGGEQVLDRPEQTTILGAAKVTGKSSGFTYGALSALTAAEYALVDAGATGGPARLERLIEPATSYNALRVQRDLGGGSNVGALATGVLRDGHPDAFAGGVDYRLRWGGNRWQWNGHWAVADAPLAGGRVSGVGGVSNLFYTSKHWNGSLHVDHFSRDFSIADMGFLRARPDQTTLSGGLNYGDPDPGTRLRSWTVGLFTGESRNTDGLVISRYAGGFGSARLLSFWSLNGGLTWAPRVFDDLETRGGPAVVVPANLSANLGLNSDPRRGWNAFLSTYGSRDAEDGWTWGLNPGVDLRPSPRFQLSLSAGFDAARDPAQWIVNEDVSGDGVVDHVFGELRSHVLNLTLRGSGAVNRDLTLEGFLQPFVAVGDYRGLGTLARPESFEFDPVADGAIADPDFNTKSLRGTFVLRWEYLRGSTVFLAWNVQGSDDARPGIFRPWQDLTDVFDASFDHRILLKANYWLSL